MGVFKDIVEIIKSEEFLDEIKQNAMTKKYSSLANRASEGTMQFPTLVTDSLDIDTLQMITKALERNYSTFLQTVLTMNSVMDTSKTSDVTDYLKQFHQNDSKVSKNDVTRNIVKLLDSYTTYSLKNGALMCETYNATTTKCMLENSKQLVDLMESLRDDKLNDKFIPNNKASVYMFRNREVSAKYNAVTEAKGKDKDKKKKKGYEMSDDNKRLRDELSLIKAHQDTDEYKFNLGVANAELQYDKLTQDTDAKMFRDRKQLSRLNVINATQQKQLNQLNIDYAKETNPLRKQQLGLQIKQINAQINSTAVRDEKAKLDMAATRLKMATLDIPQSVLRDNDVKKANELIATTMHVRLHLVNKAGEPQAVQDFILGVKAVMHLVKSKEMIDNMVAACKNNNTVFNFFRWTTGEISFFKDFWLNMSEMKRSISNEGKGASRWWNALKKRRSLGKVTDTAFVKNKILPNTSIVLSSEEAEIIKSQYGYDIMNPYFLSKIMNAYYLLGVVIVDSSSQVAHFFFDGDNDFQSVSFGGLEQENSRNERKFKEMLKTINRV